MKILNDMHVLGLNPVVMVIGLLMSVSTSHAHEDGLSSSDELIAHTDRITVSLSVDKKDRAPEAFRELCRGMLLWFEQNRERFDEKGSKDQGIELSRMTFEELERQVKKQGVDNFEGNLHINFTGLEG